MGFLQQLRESSPDLDIPADVTPPKREPVHIYSRILGTEIWVVPDGWTGELDGPIYTDSEVRELDRLQVTAEELRVIHRAKIELDGDVVGPTETGQEHPGDRDEAR